MAPRPAVRGLLGSLAVLSILSTIVVMPGGVAVADLGDITEFPLPAGARPFDLVYGADGNLWYTDPVRNLVGRVTPAGEVVEFPVPTPNGRVNAIASGPDGNMWFTELMADKIGRITPEGQITEFAVPGAGSFPAFITPGPHAETATLPDVLWFTESGSDQIGRITTQGVITEFAVPTLDSGPWGIATGKGDLWFGEFFANQVGRFDPETGTFLEYPLPGDEPQGLAFFDREMWVSQGASSSLARIDPGSGKVRSIGLPVDDPLTVDLAAGSDGNLWYSSPESNALGRVTSTHTITRFPVPTPDAVPASLTVMGPGGLLAYSALQSGQLGIVDGTIINNQPDGLRKADRLPFYAGNNVYNRSGKDQSREASFAPGGVVTISMAVQNDGNVPDRFKVRGCKDAGGFKAFYGAEGEVLGNDFTTPELLPGERFRFSLSVHAGKNVEPGTRYRCLTAIRSVGEPSQVDVIGVALKVLPGG